MAGALSSLTRAPLHRAPETLHNKVNCSQSKWSEKTRWKSCDLSGEVTEGHFLNTLSVTHIVSIRYVQGHEHQDAVIFRSVLEIGDHAWSVHMRPKSGVKETSPRVE